jgi:FkbM family methyltransferase
MVVDVGAQFGWYTLIAAKRVGARGRVWSFEPVPSNFDLLVQNIVLNGVQDIVCPVQKAIGSSCGVFELTIYAESDAHGAWARSGVPVKGVIMVECVTLDDCLRDKHVDVIKMDIEGAEPFALDGAVRTIERAERMVLIAELNPELLRRAGVEPRDYLRQLRQLGFDISIIDEKGRRLRPLSQDLIIEIEETSGWYANLYCEKGRSR